MTALHWAAERGDVEMAGILIAGGAVVDPTTRIGEYTPLHIASRPGHADVVEMLLGAGADPSASTSTTGLKPLHFAAASGSARTVSALIDRGADVDAREPEWGQTPLMFAAASDRARAIQALIAAGADPELTAWVLDLTARDDYDRTDQRGGDPYSGTTEATSSDAPFNATRTPEPLPADMLDYDRRKRAAEVAASAYSQAQLIGSYGGLTALLLAAREGHEGAVRALVDGGADIDGPSGGDLTTPLLMAIINGHFDLAILLIDWGADVGLTSDAGTTPLYATINTYWIPKTRHPQPADQLQQRTTYLEMMTTLLEAGADPDVRLTKQLWYTTFGDDYLYVDRMGATPFWRAAYSLDIEAMKLLVRYGADPHIPTRKPTDAQGGYGPAEVAGDPSGLEPVPVGGPGVYPIHAATGVGYGFRHAANQHRHVVDGWLPAVQYLVEEVGVDVNARDHEGYNAIHHAASRGDNAVIRYLVDQGGDVMAVSRYGQTTVDMANSPNQQAGGGNRLPPFRATIALLEGLGAKNNHNCGFMC